MVEFANTEEVLKKIADDTIRVAVVNLGATRTRTGYRISWKKSGKQWQVKGVQKKKYRGRITTTGRLASSLGYEIDLSRGVNLVMTSTTDYAPLVNDGTKPRSKQPPPLKILNWVNNKKLRLRVDGKFVKNTDKAREGLSYVIGRKIKHFGTEPTYFFSEPFEKFSTQYGDELAEAVAKDLANQLKI